MSLVLEQEYIPIKVNFSLVDCAEDEVGLSKPEEYKSLCL